MRECAFATRSSRSPSSIWTDAARPTKLARSPSATLSTTSLSGCVWLLSSCHRLRSVLFLAMSDTSIWVVSSAALAPSAALATSLAAALATSLAAALATSLAAALAAALPDAVSISNSLALFKDDANGCWKLLVEQNADAL